MYTVLHQAVPCSSTPETREESTARHLTESTGGAVVDHTVPKLDNTVTVTVTSVK